MVCSFWNYQSRLLYWHPAVDNIELIRGWLLVDPLELALAIRRGIKAVHSHTDAHAALCDTTLVVGIQARAWVILN